MIFGSAKITCVFCKALTKKKKAYTISMSTADGPHKVHCCEICAKEFDELAQYVEKNDAKRTYTI